MKSTASGDHKRAVYSIDWSTKNGLIATGSGDDSIRIYTTVCIVCCGIFLLSSFFTLVPPFRLKDGETSLVLLQTVPKAHSSDINAVRWCPTVRVQVYVCCCIDLLYRRIICWRPVETINASIFGELILRCSRTNDVNDGSNRNEQYTRRANLCL